MTTAKRLLFSLLCLAIGVQRPFQSLKPGLVVEAVECYSAKSKTAELPENPEKIVCDAPGSFCYKMLVLNADFIGNATEDDISFVWNCADASDEWPINGYYQCGDVSQVTVGIEILPGVDSKFEYRLGCSCCGEMCNNDTLDDQCNQIPSFNSKTCYSYFGPQSTDPALPSMALVDIIGVTDDQYCVKIAKKDQDGNVNYEWGALNIPGGRGQCGDGFKADDDGKVQHLCTCCDGLCNGPNWNGVTVDSNLCEAATTTPVAPVTFVTTPHDTPIITIDTTPHIPPVTIQTTPYVPADNGDPAAVVGGVLGGLLAAAILVIIYLAYEIYKIKRGPVAGDSERARIVQNQ